MRFLPWDSSCACSWLFSVRFCTYSPFPEWRYSIFVFAKVSLWDTLVFYFIRRYFAERGTWDPILETFIDADGDPTQFSVRMLLLFSTFVFTDVWYLVHPSCSLVCPHQCVLSLSSTMPLLNHQIHSHYDCRLWWNRTALVHRSPHHCSLTRLWAVDDCTSEFRPWAGV